MKMKKESVGLDWRATQLKGVSDTRKLTGAGAAGRARRVAEGASRLVETIARR
jgi:hypothetical protein